MRKYTPEQILGNKLEIWMEILLKDLNFRDVQRNVQYHRSRYEFRQVDLQYRDKAGNLVILEMKYSSNGIINSNLRGGKKSKSGQRIKTIDTLVRELEERRRFVRAEKGLLITNTNFSDSLYEESKKYPSLEIYYGRHLCLLDKKRSGNEEINTQISLVNIFDYDLKAGRVYI